MNLTVSQRFYRHAVANKNGCLVWVGSVNSDGYGNFWISDRCEKAHRAIWIIEKGQIPAGMHILHSCDNPSCVNIDHLRTGTIKENMTDKVMRGRHHTAGRLSCSRGHIYAKTGVNFFKQKDGGIGRNCKVCHSIRGKEGYAKRKSRADSADGAKPDKVENVPNLASEAQPKGKI